MSLLDSNSKALLVESMRHALADSVLKNKTLTESVQQEGVKFIKEDATYEQLLNLTLNPLRESKYLPSHVLEGAAAILSEAMLTGRKVIGVNAITQGALNLVKKTGCVVTESMLDAADAAARSKSLYVVAESIQRAAALLEEAKKEAAKKAVKGKVKDGALKKAFADAKEGAAKAYKATKDAVKNVGKKAAELSGVKDLQKAAKDLKKASAAKAVVKTAEDNLKGKSKQGLKNLGKGTVKMLKKSKETAKAAAKQATKSGVKNLGKGAAKAGATVAAATALGYGIKKWHDKKTAKK